MERNQTVIEFRERLQELIKDSGLTRSAFARSVGIDRSTLSQILSEASDRLPRLESVAAIARAYNVSVDWLLGLTQEKGDRPENVTQLPMEIRPGIPGADERMIEWHQEVLGQKIRYSPKTLPDLFKIDEINDFEYRRFHGTSPEQRIEATQQKLAYQRRPEADMEICSSVQGLEGFVRGEGMWKDVERKIRIKQVEHMIELLDELYPTLRWFLFDILNRYSAPIIVFGTKRASVHIGDVFFIFTTTEHIRILTKHFGELVRAAVVQPPDVPKRLEALLQEV